MNEALVWQERSGIIAPDLSYRSLGFKHSGRRVPNDVKIPTQCRDKLKFKTGGSKTPPLENFNRIVVVMENKISGKVVPPFWRCDPEERFYSKKITTAIATEILLQKFGHLK